jgi:peptidyl-tRNA hydrolase, PTH1 family
LRLIVGLGNPGPAYAKTRHNVGFWVVDALAEDMRLHFRRHGLSHRAQGSLAGQDLTLAKPQTFMNLSGPAVGELLSDAGFDAVDTGDLIVVHDDLDLEVGRIRFKARGGAGGHNGMLSIIDVLQTDRFARLKIGVGRPPIAMDPAEYVLRPVSGEDRALLNEGVERAVEALRCWISEGLPTAMNRFNRPPAE